VLTDSFWNETVLTFLSLSFQVQSCLILTVNIHPATIQSRIRNNSPVNLCQTQKNCFCHLYSVRSHSFRPDQEELQPFYTESLLKAESGLIHYIAAQAGHLNRMPV